jgi:hypothetical protein
LTTFPSMRRCLLPLLTGCLLWTGWSDLHAQEISHSTPASEAQLQDWLESGNPKLISWAATLARERHDAAFIARLPDWLHRSALITDYEYAPNRRDRRAYDAVLDALIRGDDTAEVEFLDLQELARVFPAQAFLLINRLPADKQLAILKEWFSLANLSNTRSGIAHLAAMRLAQWPTPVPGFAARILTESEEQLTIILQSRQTKSFGVGIGGCGDSMAQQPESGWPVVYSPTIEEGPNSLSGQPLIALDDDRVSYRWVEENSPGGSCAGLTGLDQRARHQILAHWLGVRDSAMGWHANMSATIVWSTQKVFKAALGDIVSKQQDAFSATVEGLTQRGLLSKSEASYSRPKLIVRLVCDINPCPIANIATRQPPDILHSLF